MKPKIVVLDGYTLAPPDQNATNIANSGDQSLIASKINWRSLQTLGDLTVYDRSTENQIIDRAKDARIVLTNKTPLNASTLSQLTDLQYVGVLATGVNVVDLQAAHEHQIVVTNVPGYSTDSVAQHVFALLLELTNHTTEHNEAVHNGDWSRSPDFSLAVCPITELAGLTLGIVGVGAIGRRVAQIGSAMGMRIAAAHQSSEATVQLPGVSIEWVSLDRLAAMADVLTLHCPLNDQTHHLVNDQLLAKMKPAALVINTGRGELVNQIALAEALRKQTIAGAGLDVLDSEPPCADNPIFSAGHCVITPHVAWASIQSKHRLMNRVVENVKAFLEGTPIHVVTPDRTQSPPLPAPTTPPLTSNPTTMKPTKTEQIETSSTQTILLLAALHDELAPTVNRLKLLQDGFLYTGKVGQSKIIAAVTGTGAERALAAMTKLLDIHGPDAVVLIGYAGGLDPRLSAGTVLPITCVINERGWAIHLDRDLASDQNASYALANVEVLEEKQRRTTEHTLVTVNRLADSVVAKRQLFDLYRCAAADMETYHLANLLAQRGIPLAILRAVSDPANMALPTASIDWIKPNGKTDVAAVIRHLLTHPWRTFSLLKLAKHARLAAQQLAIHVEKILQPSKL